MTQHIEQYEVLARKLYENTLSGSLHWQIDDWVNVPTAKLGGYTVKLEYSETAEGEPIVKVSIVNGDEYIDGFSDETLAGRETGYSELSNYWKLLDRLYSLAWRNAKGADKALEAIIKDLDEEVPF